MDFIELYIDMLRWTRHPGVVIYEFLGMSSDPFSHLYELIFISYFVWVILKILMICFYISLIFLIFWIYLCRRSNLAYYFTEVVLVYVVFCSWGYLGALFTMFLIYLRETDEIQILGPILSAMFFYWFFYY